MGVLKPLSDVQSSASRAGKKGMQTLPWLSRGSFAAFLLKAQRSCVTLGSSAELCYLNVSDSLINTTIPPIFIDSSSEVAGDLHFSHLCGLMPLCQSRYVRPWIIPHHFVSIIKSQIRYKRMSQFHITCPGRESNFEIVILPHQLPSPSFGLSFSLLPLFFPFSYPT